MDANNFDLVGAIIAFESGELVPNNVLELFSYPPNSITL